MYYSSTSKTQIDGQTDMEDKGELSEGQKKWKYGSLMEKRAMDRKEQTNHEFLLSNVETMLNYALLTCYGEWCRYDKGWESKSGVMGWIWANYNNTETWNYHKELIFCIIIENFIIKK